jgi:hypothetical protein
MPATASGITDRQHLFLTYCTTKLATAAGLTEKSTDSLGTFFLNANFFDINICFIETVSIFDALEKN